MLIHTKGALKTMSLKALGGNHTCHSRYQSTRSGERNTGKEKRQQTRSKMAPIAPHMESGVYPRGYEGVSNAFKSRSPWSS